MEPSLMVVGLNYRTAPVAVREKFWIGESRRYEALTQLSKAEGIDELIILATCNRTEFLLWANDVTLAANSVMRLLGAEYGLKLCEWKHFYRLLDEGALRHIFQVVSGIDSMVVGEPHVVSQVKQAWQQAQKVGTTGRFLDAVMHKAFAVSTRVRAETTLAQSAISIPCAAVELARQVFGTLEKKKVVLLGVGKMGELSVRGLLDQGAKSVGVVDRTLEDAVELATKLEGRAIPFEERLQPMADADLIISSSGCPHTIISRDDAELMVRGRKDRPLVIVDVALPRDVDPAVREVKGLFLYDLDDLEDVVDRNAGEREAVIAEAQKILEFEARGFRCQLMADRVVPTVVALRQRLDEISRQELESFRKENGPFSRDQDELLNAVMSRMTQRIAASLARELKDLPEKVEQEQMAIALQRLFHLQTPERALAGTIS